MDFRPFYALRTCKVPVVIFSFHRTHFHTLLTPPDFRYVNTRFDFQYTMLLIFKHCFFTLHFRYGYARFYIRCVDLSTTVDKSLRFGCTGHVRGTSANQRQDNDYETPTTADDVYHLHQRVCPNNDQHGRGGGRVLQ